MNESEFQEIKYKDKSLFFDKRYSFREHFHHKTKTRKFPYYKNLLDFLTENPEIKICFTLEESAKPFKKDKDKNEFLINVESYIQFCQSIQSRTSGRAKAFLGQNYNVADMLAVISKDEKESFIKANTSEKLILEMIKNLDADTQKNLITALQKSQGGGESNLTITSLDVVNHLAKFLTDENVQMAFIHNFPRIQIDILKKHIEFLKGNLDKNETFIQNWLDEEDGKYRKQRCLIFGVEYIDPKREGKLSEKRFDVLAEQNRNYHVIIELKSPIAEVFKVEERENANGGRITEYHLSGEIARAIPQVLGYKKWYEKATSEEIQALGLKERKKISKCIIVIGQNKDDDLVWKENFHEFKTSLNDIEIFTYTDLIDKIENTVRNLEENL